MVPFLNIPILSVALILLAGILMGHLIWYRDRSADAAAIAELGDENHDLQEALHDHKRAYAELEAELKNQRAHGEQIGAANKALEAKTHEMAQQRAKMESEMTRLHHLKDQAFHDLDQQRQQWSELGTALEQTETQLASLQKVHDALLTQHQASQQLAMEGERSWRAEFERRIEQLTQERDQALALERTAQETIRQLSNKRDAAVAAHDSAQYAAVLLRKEMAHQQAEVRRLQTELTQQMDQSQPLQAALSEKETLISQLQEDAEQLQSLEADHEELRQSLQASVERLRRVIAQRDDAISAKTQGRETIAQLQNELQTQQAALDAMQQAHEDVATQLRHEQEKQSLLMDAVESKSGTIQRLHEELRELDTLRSEHTDVQVRLNEATDRLRRLSAQRDEAIEAASNSQRTINHLEAKAKASEETIRNLRRERAAPITPYRAPMSIPLDTSLTSAPDAGSRLRRDKRLGMIYTQPPQRKNDLKKISGITEALEKKLNALGIYTYQQIMDWDAAAIAEFSKLLGDNKLMERDDWIGQSARLHQELYGRAA